MKKLILNDKQRINDWLWPRVGRESLFTPPDQYQAFGIEQDGELIAGVAFTDFATNARCTMHCAGIGKRWLTREFIHVCFDYVFNMAKCKVIVNIVDADNVESIDFTKHIGFTEMCRIPDGAGDMDLVVLAMHKSACKWI